MAISINSTERYIYFTVTIIIPVKIFKDKQTTSNLISDNCNTKLYLKAIFFIAVKIYCLYTDSHINAKAGEGQGFLSFF